MAQDAPNAMADAPWWAPFPAPKRTAILLSAEDAFAQLSNPDFLLIDVRRNDYEGGTISGSLNLPAQSFYTNRAALYRLCKQAGVTRIAFYCGSSNGRGPRCSGWFADYIFEKGDATIQSLTLAGGIKGWVKAGPSYIEKMDAYDANHWRQFLKESAPANAQQGLEASKNT